MELAVLKVDGSKSSKKVKLDDSIFAIEPNDHAIYLDVKQFLANQRQGTHSSLHRGIVSGSTKKLHKQKGTGGSRKGSIKNPLYKGGGRVFGPEPRDYSFKLNKKVKQLARKSALSYKSKESGLLVVEDFTFNSPKTKEYVSVLKNLKTDDKKTLVVLNESNKNVYLSSRNFKGSKVVNASELSTYDILNAQNLIITESAVGLIEKSLS